MLRLYVGILAGAGTDGLFKIDGQPPGRIFETHSVVLTITTDAQIAPKFWHSTLTIFQAK